MAPTPVGMLAPFRAKCAVDHASGAGSDSASGQELHKCLNITSFPERSQVLLNLHFKIMKIKQVNSDVLKAA
jgi:hypothetical protein